MLRNAFSLSAESRRVSVALPRVHCDQIWSESSRGYEWTTSSMVDTTWILEAKEALLVSLILPAIRAVARFFFETGSSLSRWVPEIAYRRQRPARYRSGTLLLPI